jgi:pimeloyl-ACP methyl ester carboxylesterase
MLQHSPATALAERGYRVILPDYRGHGDSARPHDPSAYPPDVLADDGLALIDALGLDDYDLGGYSLGGRVVLRLLVRGARPAHAIVGGQGLDALDGESGRTGGYRRVLAAMVAGESFEPGSPEAQQAHWLRLSGADPQALFNILSTHVATPLPDLGQVPTPTLVVIGEQDTARAGADKLAAALPAGRFARVPGDHLTTLNSPELVTEIIAFLSGPSA